MYLTINSIEKTDKGFKIQTDHGLFFSKENMLAYKEGFSGEFNTIMQDGKNYGYINKPLPPVYAKETNEPQKSTAQHSDNYGVNINACCARAVEIVTAATHGTMSTTKELADATIEITKRLYQEFHGGK